MNEVHPDAKRLVTNLYNRLLVITTEDIGPGDVDVAMGVAEFCYHAKHSSGGLTPVQLAVAIQLLAEAPKTRVLSHLWRVYATAPGQQLAASRGIEVDHGQYGTMPLLNWPGDPSDAPQLQHIAGVFGHYLAQRSPHAFTWLGRYLDLLHHHPQLKINSLRRRTNPVEALWVILEPHLAARDHCILRDCYYHLSENRGCLMMATFLVVWQQRSQPITHKINSLLSEHGDQHGRQQEPSLITQLLTGQYTLVLDGYVVDKHTKAGRSAGKDREVFVSEGAIVNNRAPTFDQPWFLLLEQLYQES